MMKNVLIKTGERTETRIRTIPAEYSEIGDLIREAYEETYTVTVPVMEPRNVEMTAEEIAEMEAMQEGMPEPQPAPEQRLDVLEPTTDDLVEIIADQEYRLCLMELGITNEEVNAE